MTAVRAKMAPVALCVIVALSSFCAGCARSGQRLGAGQDVGFCAAWSEFDGLDEPPVADRAKVLRWADGELRILGRVDPRVKVTIDRKQRPLPADVIHDLATVKRALSDFRDRVRKAATADGTRRAVVGLASGEFDATADRLTRSQARLCHG